MWLLVRQALSEAGYDLLLVRRGWQVQARRTDEAVLARTVRISFCQRERHIPKVFVIYGWRHDVDREMVPVIVRYCELVKRRCTVD